jgi:hypothetical protein
MIVSDAARSQRLQFESPFTDITLSGGFSFPQTGKTYDACGKMFAEVGCRTLLNRRKHVFAADPE